MLRSCASKASTHRNQSQSEPMLSSRASSPPPSRAKAPPSGAKAPRCPALELFSSRRAHKAISLIASELLWEEFRAGQGLVRVSKGLPMASGTSEQPHGIPTISFSSWMTSGSSRPMSSTPKTSKKHSARRLPDLVGIFAGAEPARETRRRTPKALATAGAGRKSAWPCDSELDLKKGTVAFAGCPAATTHRA